MDETDPKNSGKSPTSRFNGISPKPPMVGDTLDATKFNQTGEALQRQNALMKVAQEKARLGYWIYDVETGKPEWSEMMFTILGRDPAGGAPQYEDHREFIHPDDWEAFDRAVRGAISGTPYNIELRIVFPDRSIRHVMAHGYPNYDANGNIPSLYGVTQDITERKRAELEMQRYTNLLQQAEKIADMGSWEWDIENDVVYWSDGLFRIFKRDPADGAPQWAEQPNIFVTEDFERIWPVIEDCIKTGASYEFEVRAIRSDGDIRSCIARGQAEHGPDGKVVRLFGILQDITKRKRMETELRESEERYRLMVETAMEGIWLIDMQGNTLFVNQRMADMLGYSVDELQARNVFGFLDPQQRQVARRSLENRQRGVGEVVERCLLKKDGSRLWVLNSTSPIRDREGKIVGSMGMLTDITERKRVEQQLQASLINLELAQRIAHIGNWSLDPAVGVPVWSDEVYRIYERDPALGPPPVEEYKKIYAPDQYAIFHGAIQGAITEGIPYDIHLHLTLPGGKEKWVHAICEPEPTPGPAGHFLRGTIQDITEIKHAEEKLQEYSTRLEEMVAERTQELEDAQKELILKERLAVLGHFAGSVSHELRNPLGAIGSSAYLLDMKFGQTHEKLREQVGRIQSNVAKATAIIESLLNLSRSEKPRTRRTDMRDFFPGALRAIKIPSTVEMNLDLPEVSVFADIDAEQIRMALKNIVQNAVQAMDESGNLSITVRQTETGWVELAIADIGPGISAEHLEKIFEPLFSTKVHGIGFGLSITKMIVENHGGTIRAESPPDGGACFVMTLPQTGPPRF